MTVDSKLFINEAPVTVAKVYEYACFVVVSFVADSRKL